MLPSQTNRQKLAAVCAVLTLLRPSPAQAAPADWEDSAAPPALTEYLPGEKDLLAVEPENPEEPAGALPSDNQWQDVPVDEDAYHEETPVASSAFRPLSQGQPGRGNVENLYEYWEREGYPADISYAFEAGGELKDDGLVYSYWEIGLAGADESRRQQILDLASPRCLVTFYDCSFTHDQKVQAYQAVLALNDPNIVHVILTRNTDTVVVAVAEGKEKEYAQLLVREMNLGAVVSVVSEDCILDLQSESAQQSASQRRESALTASPGLGMGLDQGLDKGETASPAKEALLPFALLAAGLSLLLAALWRLSRRVLALQTVRETQTASPPLSRRQTARLVKESVRSPSPGLLPAILERVGRPAGADGQREGPDGHAPD